MNAEIGQWETQAWAVRVGQKVEAERLSKYSDCDRFSRTSSLPPTIHHYQTQYRHPSRPEHTGILNIQYRRRIHAKWPSLGTEPLAGGEATVSEAPLQSRSLIEYFNDFDDIFLFRLLESTLALPKSTRNCSRQHSHKHSTVVRDWGALADVSRLEGLR